LFTFADFALLTLVTEASPTPCLPALPQSFFARLAEVVAPLSPPQPQPNPANAAALLKQEEAATSAAGTLDVDSSGSEATAE